MAILTPSEIDALDESQEPVLAPLSPSQIDTIDLSPSLRPVNRRVAQISDVTRGGAPVPGFQVGANPLDELDMGPSSVAVGAARAAGVAAGRGGNLLAATAGDIASIPSDIAGYTQPFENIKAFTKNPDAELPIEQRANQPGSVGRFAMKAGLGLFKMEPKLAASFGLAAVGAPATISASVPMFVTDKGEFDPVGAAIAAGLPGANRWGEEAVGSALAKIPVSQIVVKALADDPTKLRGTVIQKLGGVTVSNDQFRKFLEAGGGFMAANAYLLAAQAPSLAKLPTGQRGQAVLDVVAQNIAPSLLGFIRPGLSKTLENLAPGLQEQFAKEFPGGKMPSGAAPEAAPTQPGVAPVAPLSPGEIDRLDSPSPLSTPETTGANASLLKGVPDGPPSDSEILGNIFKTPAFANHGLSGLDAPSQRMVMKTVSSVMHYPEVAQSVVGSVPVSVVHVLASGEFPPKLLLHDPSVEKNLFSVSGEGDVSLRIDIANRLIKSLAAHATLITQAEQKRNQNAINPIANTPSLPIQSQGTPPLGQEGEIAGPGDRLPGPAWQPAQSPVAVAPVAQGPPVQPGRSGGQPVAPDSLAAIPAPVAAVPQSAGEPVQPGSATGIAQPAIPPRQPALGTAPTAGGNIPAPAQAPAVVPSGAGPANAPANEQLSKSNDLEKPKSSTQLTLNPEDASRVTSFAKSIPDSEVYHKADENGKEDYGLETEPHITVLFGLTNHAAEPVVEAIKGHGPVTVTLGKLSVFKNKDYDVLKVDVKSPGIKALNKKISKLPNEQTFPDYHPHLTIAYLKAGEGQKYVGGKEFEGQKLTFDSMTFSPPKSVRAAVGRPELPLIDKMGAQAQPVPSAEHGTTSAGSSGRARGEPAATPGQAGERGPVSPTPEGPSGGVQPGVSQAGGAPPGGSVGGSAGEPNADVNGIPSQQGPAPAQPTEPEPSPRADSPVPGQPSEANPAPIPEVGSESDQTPQNIRLSASLAPGALSARVKANIEAIALVKKLDQEQRFPTEEERGILARWSGWGSFKEMFNEGRAARRDYDPGWVRAYGKNYDRLKQLLTPEEFNAAVESSVNAHFTGPDVVMPMWNLAKRLGFKGGRVLEPAFGSGNFNGYMPDDLAKVTQWTAVEMEPITAKIAGYLYPKVDLRNQPFEESKIPNGYYDLAISNVPFHEVGPGKEYPDLNLHNYFLARMLDKVKPGGLVVAITSANTMEARATQRKLLAGKCELVGAIRLPSNAFKESAATEVVTDILVLRKPDGHPFEGQNWENQISVEMPVGKIGETKQFPINEYFFDHPEMVLGENSLTGTMYRKESYTVIGKGDLASKLAEALSKFPENITQEEATVDQVSPQQSTMEDHTLVVDKGGVVMEAMGFKLQLPEWDVTSGILVARAKAYIGLRDVLMKQYALEGDPRATEEQVEANRKELAKVYASFVKKQGTLNLNDRKMGMFSADPGYYPVLGLEKVLDVPDPKDSTKSIQKIEPADVLSKRVILPDVPPDKAPNAVDALGVSLAYRGQLDVSYIKELTGMNDQQVEAELIANDLAFKDPESARMVTKVDYLSGDVRDKLAKAIFAAKESPEFQRNVDSLRATIPQTVPFDRVSVGIAARWTPVQVLNSFANKVLGLSPGSITLIPTVEEFAVKEAERWQLGTQARAQWSTQDLDAATLLQHALNFKRAEVRRRTDDDKYVVDEPATALANQIIEKMGREFVAYVRTSKDAVQYQYFDPDVGAYKTDDLPIWDAMEREFNKRFNSFVDPKYDGSVLKLPGLSIQVRRTPHLLNGVMRSILSGSAVFAHGVGSGKTFLLVTMAHELQRVGLAKKMVIVVKKPTVAQYRMSIERAYPGSKCLIPHQKDFEKGNRKKLVSRIASNRWDFIILSHEQFKAVRPGEQLVKDFFNEQIEQLRQILRDMGEAEAEDAKSTRGMVPAVRNIVKKLKSLKKKLDQHMTSIQKRQDVGLNWEQIGIDGLAMDEAHNFRKIPIPTTMDGEIKGIPTDFSQRAVDLLVKARDVQRRTNGRNVFFASGTPVSNTLAELWVMFHVTNPNLLKAFSVETFDSFASAFADVVSNFEFGWDNKFHDVTRMARFKNPSGLSMLTRLGMDVRIGNKELGLDVPELQGGKPSTVIVKTTPTFDRWLQLLDRSVAAWETADPQTRFFCSWVPITVMRAGVAAALDPRCVFPGAQDEPSSKVNQAINLIHQEWLNGREDRTTMMVFADMYRTMNTSKLMGFIGGEGRNATEVEQVPEEAEAADETGDTGAKDEADFIKNAVGGFNLYNDIRSKLVARGVPENEIAIIAEHDTDTKRDKLFNLVRSGQVRVLIGSTEKIGEGVDVPQRMSAQFHLDPPMQMTPAKMEQRIGRIIRQGNLHSPKNWNKPVRIYMFAQERSMDAAIYQMLETKSIMILQALKGQTLGDSFEDPASELSMAMAEMKAAATGDTRILEFARLKKEVRELSLEEAAFLQRKSELRRNIDERTRHERYALETAQRMTRLSGAIRPAIADGSKLTLLHVRSQKRVTGQENVDNWLKAAQGTMLAAVKEPSQTASMSLIFGDKVRCLVEMKHGLRDAYNQKGEQVKESHFPVTATFYLGDTAEPKWDLPRWDSSLSSLETLVTALKRIPAQAETRAQIETQEASKSAQMAAAYTEEFNKTAFEKSELLAQKRAELLALESDLRGKKKGDQAPAASHDGQPPLPSDPFAVLQNEATAVAPPLHYRIISQMLRLQPLMEQADDAAQVAAMRTRAAGKSDDIDFFQEALAKAEEESFDMQERMQDLQRRLATVEKARLGAARAGSLAELPYSRTLSKAGRQYAIESPEQAQASEAVRAHGLQAVRSMIADPSNGLSQDTRAVALAMLDEPGLRALDWDRLAVEIKDRLPENTSGSLTGDLMELARGARPSTFPHEMFHVLWRLLPEAVQKQINESRLEELLQTMQKAEQLKLPSSLFDLLSRMAGGDITSDEYLESLYGLSWNPDAVRFARDHYYLSTPSEYLAGIGGDQYSKQRFTHRNDGLFDRFIEKIKGWINSLLDALRRFFGMRTDIQQIIRELLNGKYKPTPEETSRAQHARELSIDEPEPPPKDQLGASAGEVSIGESADDIITRVFKNEDTVRGASDRMTPDVREAGRAFAQATFAKAGLQVEEAPDGFFQLVDPDFDSEIEGQRLLKTIRDEIGKLGSGSDLETGYLGNLVNSIRVHFTADNIGAFSQDLKDSLYAAAQSEARHRGVMLAALQGFGKDIEYIARHVNVNLHREWGISFAGEFVEKVLRRVATDFTDYFTPEEIEDALSKRPQLQEFIDLAAGLMRRQQGHRVFNMVQAQLAPKNKKKLAKLEADARVNEAARDILQQAKAQGIEPKPSPNKPLPAITQLMHLVNPKTAPKIEKLVAQAISDARRAAGIKAALASAVSEEERQDMQDRFTAGEEPTDEQIEQGLKLPQYSHWKTIQETMLGYNPVTIKLVEKLIKEDFSGTRFAQPAEKKADNRINLEALAKAPEGEVRRVLDAYVQNLSGVMGAAAATPATRQKVSAMVEEAVAQQLEKARARVREPLFKPPTTPKKPPTPEQRIGQLINAGLLGDERLNAPEFVQRVATRSAIGRLTPKAADLVTKALQTPFYRVRDLSRRFAENLVSELGINPEQAAKAEELLESAFSSKFQDALVKARKQAEASLTPKERREFKAGKPIWRKVIENVNVGNFDTGDVLRQIASANGWAYSQAAVDRLRELSDHLQKLQTLTPQEVEEAASPEGQSKALKEKIATTLDKRVAIKKEMQAHWARLTKPLSIRHWWNNKANFGAAANDFEVANMLLKAGYPLRLLTHVTSQVIFHFPTRAAATAFDNFFADKAAGRETRLWVDLGHTLSKSIKDLVASFGPAMKSARAAFGDRTEGRGLDRVIAGVAMLERAELKADELSAQGKTVQATMYRLLSWMRFSLKMTQALDAFQGTPIERQEMRAIIVTSLRENGRSPAESEVLADQVLGTTLEKIPEGIARAKEILDRLGESYTPITLEEAGRRLAQVWAWQKVQELGLPADDFQEEIRLVRSANAWQERCVHGLGGLVSGTGKRVSGLIQQAGLPFSFARFASAAGTGINYYLMFTPFYAQGAVPTEKGAGPSPFFKSQRDIYQRRIQAILGSMAQGLFFALAALGMVIYRTKWKDKKDRDMMEAAGHRLYTIEIPEGDGKFFALSSTVGMMAPFVPGIAAGQAVADLLRRRDVEQAKMDQDAAKRGLQPGKIRPVNAADVMGIAGEAALNVVMGGKTMSGVTASMAGDMGSFNSRKMAAAYISPMIPGLPGYQEVSRMMGVTLDSKLASVWDYLVPVPGSQAQALNLLGDPVGNPDAVQRVLQTMTAGTYGIPWPVQVPFSIDENAIKSNPAYAALFASQYRPGPIDPGKGYAINGDFRPMTDQEVARYAKARGEEFKQALTAIGPDADRQSAKQAFEQANQRALERVGVDAGLKPETSSEVSPPVPGTVAASPRLGGMPASRGFVGFRGLRSGPKRLRSAAPSVRGPRLTTSLRGGRGLPRIAARAPSGSGGVRSLKPRVTH